jgi:uncharacterized Ntn-hydrolase superfamily protein
MRSALTLAALVAALPLAACLSAPATDLALYEVPDGSAALDTLTMNTWSIIAADPVTGDVGVAMASCVRGAIADALGALVPGKGVSATQAGFDIKNRNRTFEALKAGKPADSVILAVIDTAGFRIRGDTTGDRNINGRQYGVVTISGGRAQTAGFTGQGMLDGANRAGGRFAGVRSNPNRGVSAQGNTLVSEHVVADALAAFLWDDPTGFNTITDRLMRGIEAGSIAGGDVRCNNATTRQTAATAMIIAARGTDAPYATPNLNASEQGTPNAPWLDIALATPQGEFTNPLLELRKRYDEWRRTTGAHHPYMVRDTAQAGSGGR